jgi:hypothetical protein
MKAPKLNLAPADRAFLVEVAEAVLGGSDVAATTASRLHLRGIDIKRVDSLVPLASEALALDGIVMKKIAADHETPDNFGLFVRRRP